MRKPEFVGENTWSFGQVLPCAMLLAPVLVFLDTLGKSWLSSPGSSSPPIGKDILYKTILPCLTPTRERHRDQKPSRYPLFKQGSNAPGPTSAIHHLELVESQTLSALSFVPLVTFETYETTQRPFLHYFEDIDCFPLFVLQIGVWVCFVTFCVFFRGFDAFRSIVPAEFPSSPDSLSYNTLYLCFYIFLIGPTWSCFFLLVCPRKELLPRSFIGKIVRYLVFLVYLLLPILNYVFLSQTLLFVIHGPFIFAGSNLVYMAFAILYTLLKNIPPRELP